MTATTKGNDAASAFQSADTAELLDFFDDLGVFADLETNASVNTASSNSTITTTPTATDVFLDPHESFVSLLTTPLSTLDHLSTVLHDVDTTTAMDDGERQPAMEPLLQVHLRDDCCFDAFDFAFHDAAAHDPAAASTAPRTLDLKHAPLDFNRDYDSDPNCVASEPMVQEEDSVTAEQQQSERPKKKKKKKKSTSQRQKEELAYLRSKVSELESALENIQGDSPKEGDPKDAGTAQPVRHRIVASRSMWQLAAKRQLEDKNRAELENARLRAKMAGQIKFAKSLERMLRKRRIWEVMQDNQQHRFMELSAKDSEIFELLATHINARVQHLDAIFDAHGLTDARTTLNQSDIAADDEDGLRIDFTNAATTPFDFRKVSNVVWKHLGMKNLKLTEMDMNCPGVIANVETMQIQIIEQTDDTLVMKQSVTSTSVNDMHDTTVHSVSRRILQENRVLMLWESLTESKGSVSRGMPAVQVITKGCGKITRCDDTVDGPAASLLQSYVCVVPNMMEIPTDSESEEDQRPPRQRHTIGLLTNLIISSYQQNAQTVRQFIENALFDDLIHGGDSDGRLASVS